MNARRTRSRRPLAPHRGDQPHGMEGIKALFGIPLARALDLARPIRIDVGRIGYPDEGLRLTLSIDSPYQFNAEVKLSRADAQWLVARLQAELVDPRNENLPAGRT